jgi:hypothetical protein
MQDLREPFVDLFTRHGRLFGCSKQEKLSCCPISQERSVARSPLMGSMETRVTWLPCVVDDDRHVFPRHHSEL